MTNTYPRETVEFIGLNVKNIETGAAITVYQVQITASRARPIESAWAANTSLDGKHGVLISGLAPGTYRVWARINGNPENPVIDCGTFVVT